MNKNIPTRQRERQLNTLLNDIDMLVYLVTVFAGNAYSTHFLPIYRQQQHMRQVFSSPLLCCLLICLFTRLFYAFSMNVAVLSELHIQSLLKHVHISLKRTVSK